MALTKAQIVELLKPIKIVKVLEINKHPNADRLVLVKVQMSLDPNDVKDVVAGAMNMRPGDLVLYLGEGNVIPGFLILKGEKIMLQKKMLRGLESDSMILAEDEIGMSRDHTGIFIINNEELRIKNEELIGKSLIDVISNEILNRIFKNAGLKDERVYAFIDSQNLNLGVHSLGWKLDFKRFRVYLKDKLKVTKAFLFIGFVEENQKMYDALKSYDYELIFKPAIKFKKKSIKGNVDAELVLHSAKLQYQNYDKAVVVSGDGDFFCLVEDMVREKRLQRLVIPNRKSQSSLLKCFENHKLFLERERIKLERKY